MPAISAYYEKVLLDFSLKGSTGTIPAAWAVGLSTASPTSVAGSEIQTGSGYTRQTLTMVAAASPAGTASNSVAMTFGPMLTAATVQGIHIWDTVAATSGNMIWYGTLATARTLGVGDSLVIAAGALVVSLT